MTNRTLTIFRTYQASTHNTLGFFSGEEDAVLQFCSLKFDIEPDDIALEKVPVRRVTRSEVVCFSEIMDQLKVHKERVRARRETETPETVKSSIIRILNA
ncbi:MAG TPA: hypothetical protein ENK47_06905 [Euryarchaeota archaeon]|nr:hypothetical protein [Euryarchaeota archaeon]